MSIYKFIDICCQYSWCIFFTIATLNFLDCLEDQISRVLNNYLSDYFQKEISNMKDMCKSNLLNAIGDEQLLTTESEGRHIGLKPNKFQSIKQLNEIVGESKVKFPIDPSFDTIKMNIFKIMAYTK